MDRTIRIAVCVIIPIVVFCAISLFVTFDAEYLDLSKWTRGSRFMLLYSWGAVGLLMYFCPWWDSK